MGGKLQVPVLRRRLSRGERGICTQFPKKKVGKKLKLNSNFNFCSLTPRTAWAEGQCRAGPAPARGATEAPGAR